MATQASAITFLSAPGLAYTDGMQFVQFYCGLPIALVILSAFAVPLYYRLNVYTAYEFLEKRFDRKTRIAASVLFLLSRGVSTGISIYAPSIIVSTMLGWNIYLTNILVGGALLLYTMRGGARSVAHTQTLMFGIILTSMAVAGIYLVQTLPPGIGLGDAVHLADLAGRMNVITTTFDLDDKYNLWSGLFGGFFLALSYFGTDQSQVGRFLTGRDVRESRIGLLVNGIVKIPMQFAILFLGVLLVALYTVVPSPIFFNERVVDEARMRDAARTAQIERLWTDANAVLHASAQDVLSNVSGAEERYKQAHATVTTLRGEYRTILKDAGIVERNDTNYVFLHYVRTALPAGLVGLLFAVVVLASWGSISAGFHSLATASVVDLHDLFRPSEKHDPTAGVRRAQWHTLGWGLFGIAMSMLATRMGSLIEAVNILGSLFYGPILGIFLVAFYVKRATGTATFWAAVIAEAAVLTCWWFDVVSFLWLNVIGVTVVAGMAWVTTPQSHQR
jgi:Na+/proline symporter